MNEKKNNLKLPKKCPSCGNQLQIISLQCPTCETEVKGSYPMGLFSGLSEEEENFLLCFLSSRGSLKEVQERLNISYPTARIKLNRLLSHLGFHTEKEEEDNEVIVESGPESVKDKMKFLIEQLDEGKVDFESVLREIREIKEETSYESE
ncbi:DUF2089 domain-containing protein [bacterium]|nr:DUF2089 domain-containing protein [bacterium]